MEQDAFEKMQGSKLYRFFEMASVLILMNACMILLSLCGLVVLGLFPATLAAAAYFHDVLTKQEGKMFSSMFRYFRQYFWIGNLLMLITVPTIALGFYLIYGREFATFAYFLLFTWIILVAVLCWYLPAVNVLYPEFSVGKKILFSMVAACDRWLWTIFFLIVSMVWLYAVLLLPQLLMFVMLSVPAAIGMWGVRRALKKDTTEEEEEEEEGSVEN